VTVDVDAFGEDEATRLSDYISLGRQLCAVVEGFAGEVSRTLKANPTVLGTRDAVLAGLALKIENALRSLLDDCERRRSEAMHHLKTMVEAFIYLFIVVKDETDTTAGRVIATAAKAKEKYARLNPESPHAKYLPKWTARLTGLAAHGFEPFHRSENLQALMKLHEPELGEWYSLVYRLACDPAHLGDLPDFMPSKVGEFRLGGHSSAAMTRALLAAHYGLAVAIETLAFVSQANKLGVQAPVDDLSARFTAISE
jgi:hypothetical protein